MHSLGTMHWMCCLIGQVTVIPVTSASATCTPLSPPGKTPDSLRNADTARAHGMPVAWSLRRLGLPGQKRINSPDLMWNYCEHAAVEGQLVFVFGSTDYTPALLQERLESAFKGLSIADAYSRPFGH